jgi:hypothetical protein
MAKTPAAASGPLEFTDEGEQFVIPLSHLYFDAAGALKTDSTLYAQHQARIDAWLDYLKKQGLVTPAPQPPPAPAMVIKAKDRGSAGNNITLTFSNPRKDAQHNDIFDASLTETDTYPDLTPDTIKDVLGPAPGSGSKPGLVYVSSAGAPTQPADGDYQLGGNGPYTVDVHDVHGNVAFTLTSKAQNAEALHTAVHITGAADPNKPNTFTLVAEWTKQPAVGITPGALEGNFAYEITVSPPEGGQLRAPAPGTVALRGGSDAQGPTTAAVTVTAGE